VKEDLFDMDKFRVADLPPVARTMLVSLACRAEENLRPDAMVRDARAAEILARFDPEEIKPLKLSAVDHIFTMMRARQFDRWAKAFLEEHPGAIVVDLGCGLDARAARVDDGRRLWIGLDMPEVIALRKSLIPAGARERLIEGSVLDPAWIDAIAAEKRPVIFLAEGVFPYLPERELRGMIVRLAERFSIGELAFDVLTRFSVRLHNLHPLLRKSGARLQWGMDDGREMERWSPRLHWVETWKYFDRFEPRLGKHNLMRFLPVFSGVNYIVRYRLSAIG
jgi:O-methyltransferase involved in polyketide biosynthesis